MLVTSTVLVSAADPAPVRSSQRARTPVDVFSGHRQPVGFAIDAGLVLSMAEPGRAGRAGEPQHRSRMRRFHGLQLEGRDVVPGPQ